MLHCVQISTGALWKCFVANKSLSCKVGAIFDSNRHTQFSTLFHQHSTEKNTDANAGLRLPNFIKI